MQTQYGSEGTDDSRSRGQVEYTEKITTQRRDQKFPIVHPIARRVADAVGEEHGPHRRYDQIAEDKQHSGDRH